MSPAVLRAALFLGKLLREHLDDGMSWSEIVEQGQALGHTEISLRRGRGHQARPFQFGRPARTRWFLAEDELGRWLDPDEHRARVRGRRCSSQRASQQSSYWS